jgi:phasin family protein
MFKTYDDVLSFNQANVDAFVQCGTQMAAGVEQIAKEAFTFAGKSFEASVENVKAVTGCKTASEVISLQQKLAKDNFETFMAETNKLSEMSSVVAKSAMEPLQSRYKAAFDGMAAK